MDTNSGDPRGFVQEEDQADEAVCEEEECYSSDSDDDDVGRYVFLARQPAPAEASDDDDGAMPVGEGGGGRKRHLGDREISDAPPPPPPAQKARLGLTGPHGAGPEEAVRFRGGDQAKTTNRKRGRGQREPLAAQGRAARGGKMKKSRIRSGGEDGRQAEAAPVLMQKKSFLCSVCGRCFGSHQALGGHVHFGHRKTAKTINAASLHDGVAGGNGCRDEKVSMAMVEAAVSHEDAAVAASSGESDPDGYGNGKKSRQGVDSSSGRLRRNDDGSSNGRGIKNGAANNYHGDHGDGGESNVGQEKVTVAVVTSRNGGNGTERKVAAAVGRCNESTNGKAANGGVVRKTQHRCEVCGKECLSGQALGGHMRKHRKQSPEADGTPVLV
ncbi:hypothetical protein BRADI_1g11785v3 [Brachypodium distachyon]|uniref:C2H2-type domain-containing protein n=1 Tax=Brachypodium distachyon TaxID=15368 RepID=A0A0Q3GTJ2_BRADI|nr:hypothetical protein BRADI_1g11785v3 [Brachypodium distachyon]